MLSLDLSQVGGGYVPLALACALLYALIDGPLRDWGWRRTARLELDLADRLSDDGVEGDAARALRKWAALRALRSIDRREALRGAIPDVVGELRWTLFFLATDVLWAAQLLAMYGRMPLVAAAVILANLCVGLVVDAVRRRGRRERPHGAVAVRRESDDQELERLYREIMAAPTAGGSVRAERLGEDVDPEPERGDGQEHPDCESHGASDDVGG